MFNDLPGWMIRQVPGETIFRLHTRRTPDFALHRKQWPEIFRNRLGERGPDRVGCLFLEESVFSSACYGKQARVSAEPFLDISH